MKNKTHEFIIKAFLASRIPPAVKKKSFELISMDSVLAGFGTRLLEGEKDIDFQYVITTEDKKAFSELINHAEGHMKSEIIIYYRLAVLTEEVLLQYSTSN